MDLFSMATTKNRFFFQRYTGSYRVFDAIQKGGQVRGVLAASLVSEFVFFFVCVCACAAWNSTTTVNWPAECLSRHNRNRGKSDVFFRRREFDVFVGRSPFDGPRIGREFGQKMIASSPCVSPPLICYSSSSVGWVGKTGFKWRSIKDGRRTFSRALYSAFMELFFFLPHLPA